MRRRARGLTLLELLVVLAIVAVMMTLALPSFGSIVARHRLKAAAEQLSADLGELRLLAVQRGQALHLDLQPGTQWCYALTTVSGCDCRVPQGCQLKTVRAADHPGVTLLAGGDMLVDARNIAPLQHSGHALLQGSEGAQLRVGLTPLGRPKVCAPNGAVPGYPTC
jgi:type IV fimbrial biogenesis protein FimT